MGRNRNSCLLVLLVDAQRPKGEVQDSGSIGGCCCCLGSGFRNVDSGLHRLPRMYWPVLSCLESSHNAHTFTETNRACHAGAWFVVKLRVVNADLINRAGKAAQAHDRASTAEIHSKISQKNLRTPTDEEGNYEPRAQESVRLYYITLRYKRSRQLADLHVLLHFAIELL